MPRTLSALIVLALLSAGPAAGDTLYLRDGRELSGTVTKSGGKVRIELAHGTLEFPESEVVTIAYGTSVKPASAPTVETPAPARPVVLQPAVRWDPEACTTPEPIVFMLARQAELAGGTDSTATQLKQWQIAVHEGKRKWRDQWLSRDDRRRHVGDFDKNLKQAADQLRQARAVYGSTPADLAKKKRLESQAEQDLQTAAGAWPDTVISEFLLAVLDIRADRQKQADARLRRLVDDEPLLAGLHQGRGLCLSAAKQPLAALAEFVACLELRDDSYEPVRLVEETLKDVPGAQVKDPVYTHAQDVLGRYEKPKYPPRAPTGGVAWLMPGRGWQSRDDSLFTPPYERIICRQALAIPISQDCLVLDKTALAGAELLYVQVAPDLVVRADPPRTGVYTGSTTRKTDLPLALIRAYGASFTPVEMDKPVALKAGQSLTLRAANAYRRMGTDVRVGDCEVVSADEPLELKGGILPGETLGALFEGEAFAALATARVDAEADDCGKSAVIKPAELTAWITAAKRNLRSGAPYRTSGGPTLKPDAQAKPAAGQAFVVYILDGENVPEKVAQ